MRPENFSVPEYAHGYFSRTFQWAFVPIDVINVRTIFDLKCVALPVPEIIGGTQKIWAVPEYAHALFSQNFNGLLFLSLIHI